jgi:hypothetical protein
MSKLKEIVLADASTEAKVAALAVLVDKKLLELAEVVMSTKKLEGPKGEQGLQGPKGEQGDRGLQGDKGLDGKDGVDGKDGKDGADGVSVVDAKIDFDGTLVITLSNGKEITAGDVVPEGIAKDVNIITSGNGTAKVVTDTLASLQAQIDAITGLDGELGTMAQQDDTAVDINGGAIDGTIVGAVTPAAGTFTTLIGGGGSANYGQLTGGVTTKAIEFTALGSDTNVALALRSQGTGAIDLAAGSRGVNISNGGTVTAITRTAAGSGYTSAPTVTISAPTTAGGVQATATCTVTAGAVNTTFTITNAGSGYVEQPTVTFSGGGGSGAAAYATVGSGAIIRSLGSTGTQSLSFYTPSGEILRLRDTGSTGTYVMVNTTSSGANILAQGSTNAFFGFNSNGTGAIQFGTNGNTGNTQLQVSHTASAVNYVQVTGAATGAGPIISVQGSDANAEMRYRTKGVYNHSFQNGNGNANFIIDQTAGNSVVNRLQVAGSVAGSAPSMSSVGSDTNIDLALTPKGTGLVKFGTYTAGAPAATGYISVKSAAGVTYKILVST